MDELLKKLTANGFAEIEGLQVTGTLPVRQDIVNDVITDLLRNVQSGSASTGAGTSAATPVTPAASATTPAAEKINWAKLISKLQVQLKEGKLIIDFELRR